MTRPRHGNKRRSREKKKKKSIPFFTFSTRDNPEAALLGEQRFRCDCSFSTTNMQVYWPIGSVGDNNIHNKRQHRWSSRKKIIVDRFDRPKSLSTCMDFAIKKKKKIFHAIEKHPCMSDRSRVMLYDSYNSDLIPEWARRALRDTYTLITCMCLIGARARPI